MITRKIATYIDFARRCFALLSGRHGVFSLFLLVSVVAAMTEGGGVSLLVGGRARARSLAVGGVLRSRLSVFVGLLGAGLPLTWEQKLNARSFAALTSVEIGYINENDIGDMQNGLYNWPRRVSDMLGNFAVLISNGMTLCVYFGLMLLVTWRLTLLAAAFVIGVSVLVKMLTSGALYRAGVRISEAGGAPHPRGGGGWG